MDRGDIVSLLKSEAKRRPKVAALLDRVHELTDEEIDTADVPLKWFKQGLRVARDRARIKNVMAETEAAMGPLVIIDTSVNTKPGCRIQYTGMGFFALSRTGISVEIKTYDWFFLPETGGAWQNQTFFEKIPTQVLQYHDVLVQRETRWDYIVAWDEELPKRYGGMV